VTHSLYGVSVLALLVALLCFALDVATTLGYLGRPEIRTQVALLWRAVWITLVVVAVLALAVLALKR